MKRIETATQAGDADCAKLIKAAREIVSGVHRVSGRKAAGVEIPGLTLALAEALSRLPRSGSRSGRNSKSRFTW